MQLFYSPEITNQQFHLSADESRHAIKVLRKGEGERLRVVDGEGGYYEVEITIANHKKCEFLVVDKVEQYNPIPYRLHIAIAPTKNNDRFEWFLEKATEIGITEITPILCDHSERKVIKEERLTKVLVSAMKQSGQAFLPKLNPLTKLSDLIKVQSVESKYIAHCEEQEQKKLNELYKKGSKSLVLIGPEGDFSTNEIKLALDNNFKPISLGNNRLRTETAGVIVCSTINLLES